MGVIEFIKCFFLAKHIKLEGFETIFVMERVLKSSIFNRGFIKINKFSNLQYFPNEVKYHNVSYL